MITGKGNVKKVHDTVNDVEFDEGPDSEYEKCRRGEVMAFTTYHNPGIKVPKFRDSIQLCPWFLNKIGHTQFDLPEKSRLSKMTKGILGSSTAKLPNSTPIDSEMYFIHVLIHEVGSFQIEFSGGSQH